MTLNLRPERRRTETRTNRDDDELERDEPEWYELERTSWNGRTGTDEPERTNRDEDELKRDDLRRTNWNGRTGTDKPERTKRDEDEPELGAKP